MLADPAVTSRMADTKALAEVKALENFYTVLQTEPSRAFYGLKHVLKANEAQAIDTLLVSDNLFRYLCKIALNNMFFYVLINLNYLGLKVLKSENVTLRLSKAYDPIMEVLLIPLSRPDKGGPPLPRIRGFQSIYCKYLNAHLNVIAKSLSHLRLHGCLKFVATTLSVAF